jgi:hypothetical protein
MDESLDIFLQPSRRLIIYSMSFVFICGSLLYFIPWSYTYKVFLFALMAVVILMELRSKVFLTSSSSIIRIGFNLTGSSNQRWWYQRRSGEKVFAELSSASRVWADWVALDFSRWPWQIGHSVVIARDSVEDIADFQRLKRILRSR